MKPIAIRPDFFPSLASFPSCFLLVSVLWRLALRAEYGELAATADHVASTAVHY